MPPENSAVGVWPNSRLLPGTRRAFFAHYGGDPFWNMAVDDLLLAMAAEPGTLFIRLYTWQPAAITIGANQRLETALDISQLGDTPVVRRITGGRALFHDNSEFTYALAANLTEPAHPIFCESPAACSAWVASRLGEFTKRLGVPADWQRQSSDHERRPVSVQKAACFASAARHELVGEGRKIVASAQRRSRCALLQHGAIKLYGIAPHPALSGVHTSDLQVAQLITEEQFRETAEQFRRVWECGTALTLGSGDSCDLLPADTLSGMVARLRDDPLLIRQPD